MTVAVQHNRTRSVSVEVQSATTDVDAVLDAIVADIHVDLPVSKARQTVDGILLRTTSDAVVEITMQPVRQAGSRPVDTFVVSTTVLDAGRLSSSALNRVFAAGERVPLTGLEWSELVKQMPLTHGLPGHLPAGALGSVAPVLTVHHMTDFLVLVDATRRLGVPAESVTVIDKGYRYQKAARVDAYLRQCGISVWPWTRTEEALADHASRANRANRVGLLIDDGGYTLPILMAQRPELLTSFCGLVEQTMSGITKLERFTNKLPMPIFSVAESRLKSTIESYGVADAAVRNILQLLPNEKFEGQAALVLGFGRIGEQVAEILRSRRMRVAVYDDAVVRLIAAHERGFVTNRFLALLVSQHRPLLIVGSSGRTSFRGEHAAALNRDCYLVSTTSRDTEFSLTELGDEATASVRAGILGRQLTLRNGVKATIVGDGFPINFHYAESMPNKYADLILASLLVGAATLASPGHGFVAGHNVAESDRVLESSGLLERYYDRFGPDAR